MRYCDICGGEHFNRKDNLCNDCRIESKLKYCDECGNTHKNRVSPFCNACRKGKCDICRDKLSKEAVFNHFTICKSCYIVKKTNNRPPAICYLMDD